MDDVIKGVAVPEIPKKRAIKTGQNAGKSPTDTSGGGGGP